MKVIILAGGKATRLPKSAKKIPKALVKIKGKPLLEWQLDLLKKYGFDDLRFSLGEKADQILEFLKKKKIKFEAIIEKEPLLTGGAIKFASRDLKEPFMVIFGDILADINLKKFLDFFHKKKKNIITLYKVKDATSYGLAKIRKDGRVKEFLEKPQKKMAGYINANFSIFYPEVFKKIKKKKFLVETEVYPQLAKKGELYAYIHRGKWIDIGTEERLKFARHHFKIKI
ncbi:MAG: NDP-sugar synthase [Patescibacteria group bacterium]